MKKPALLLLGFALALYSYCQDAKAEIKQDAMQQFQWLAGTWTGRSEVDIAGKKQITYIEQTITPVLDGTIYTVAARGTAPDSATQKQILVYNSFGVISYDIKDKQYRWKTWRNPGDTYDEATITVGDKSFEFTTGENGGYTRYKANLDDKGQWIETGEYAKDNVNWRLFITMQLHKKE